MKKYFYLFTLLISLSVNRVLSQGCSDAGFCSAGAMQSTHKVNDSSELKSSIGFSVTYGLGENSTHIIIPQLEGKLVLNKKLFIEAKLPINITDGNVGNHTGIGDPIITASYIILANKKFSLLGTLGARFGLGNADASYKGKSLPMPYQSSLGTTDLIVGLGAFMGRYIKLAAAYQQPLIQYNKNGYIPNEVYPEPREDTVYFASKNLNRKGDVLFRAEAYRQWKKISIAAGPLFIYHLGEDTYSTISDSTFKLNGSKGMTINLSASVSYNLKNARLDVLAGTPFLVRDYRPDGLTRAVVITIRYTYFK